MRDVPVAAGIIVGAVLAFTFILGWASYLHRLPATSVTPPAVIACDNNVGVRAEFIGLNERILQLFRQARLSTPALVAVGAKPCDGTGDALPAAIAKVNQDLDRLAPFVLSEAP